MSRRLLIGVLVVGVGAVGSGVASAGVAGMSAERVSLVFTAKNPVKLTTNRAVKWSFSCSRPCDVVLRGYGTVRKNGRVQRAPGTEITGAFSIRRGKVHRETLYASDNEVSLMRRYGSVTYKATAVAVPLNEDRPITTVHRTVKILPPD